MFAKESPDWMKVVKEGRIKSIESAGEKQSVLLNQVEFIKPSSRFDGKQWKSARQT